MRMQRATQQRPQSKLAEIVQREQQTESWLHLIACWIYDRQRRHVKVGQQSFDIRGSTLEHRVDFVTQSQLSAKPQ